MARDRRTKLTAVSSTTPKPAAAEPQPAATAPAATGKDARYNEETEVLYARLPAQTKRRLKVASAMTGRTSSELVADVLDLIVDPADTDLMRALAQLDDAEGRARLVRAIKQAI